ncbi:hypothetical protein ACZ90_15770 [Streptomyces albus subsp. albus]|nr:hypothetical protein ACZ90_15770 [Streptomyces albus subsp. albus]
MPGAARTGSRTQLGRRLRVARVPAPPAFLGIGWLLAAAALSGCSSSSGGLPKVDPGTPRHHATYHSGSSEPSKGDPDFPDTPAGDKSELENTIRNDTDASQKVKKAEMRSPSSAKARSAAGLRTGDIETRYDGCSGKTIKPGKSCQVLFRFAPTTQSTLAAEFTVDFSGSTPDIQHQVTAVALPPSGSASPTTAPTGTAPPSTATSTPTATGTATETGSPTTSGVPSPSEPSGGTPPPPPSSAPAS